MSWVAVAVVGGAVIGGVASNHAAGKAADAQENAANKASDTQLQMFNQQRTDSAPWRDAGTQALSQMLTGTKPGGEFNRNFTMADFVKDPGYDFRMQQGQNAVDHSASARGGVLSGRAIKDTERFGQDYASGEYGKAYDRYNNDLTTRYNRLANIAGTGQTATAQLGQQGTQVAGQLGENYMQAGNARASGYVGQANAFNNAGQTIGNYFQTQQMMSQMGNRPPTAGATAGSWGSSNPVGGNVSDFSTYG
jgi:hypothetical protein